MEVRLDALLLSFPAGFFWLWYVYRRCRVHPPPLALVAVAFVCGMCSPLLVIGATDWLESIWPALGRMPQDNRVGMQIFYFIVMVGLIEETAKMLSVRFTVYYSKRFDDAIHGVVFSSAAALGFATLENARYVDWHGVEVLLGRAILSTFGHVLQSMIWGFAMGLQRTGMGGWTSLLMALCAAAVVHGIYDLLLMYNQMWLALLLLFALWRIFLGHVDAVSRASPHRARISRRVRECSACHALVRGEGQYCGACGRSLGAEGGVFCAVCLKSVDGNERSCASCHSLLA